MRGSGHSPVAPAVFDGVVMFRNPSRYTIAAEAERVAPHGPAKSPSVTLVTVSVSPAGALTATWNAQNSLRAHDSEMLVCAGGGGSVGRTFCVSVTAATVTAARAAEPRERTSVPATAAARAMSFMC